VGAARGLSPSKRLAARGLPFIRIAVNVRPFSFAIQFLAGRSCSAARLDLEPQYLEIELTETTVMDNAEDSVAIPSSLSRMGVSCRSTIWDGLSSMSYLRRFPIDKLKIDRSFISE